jgi:hypothetical protein
MLADAKGRIWWIRSGGVSGPPQFPSNQNYRRMLNL